MSGSFVDEYIDGCQVSYTVMTDITDIMRMKIEQSITYDNLPGFVGKYRVQRGPRFTLLEANDRYVDFFGPGCWKGMEDPLYRQNFARNGQVFWNTRNPSWQGSRPILPCRCKAARERTAGFRSTPTV